MESRTVDENNILCVLAGFVARFLPALFDHPVLPLFFALGLIFADHYLYRRHRFPL